MQDRDADLQRLSDRRSHYATVTEIAADFEQRAAELARLAKQARDERDYERARADRLDEEAQALTADAARLSAEERDLLDDILKHIERAGNWPDEDGMISTIRAKLAAGGEG